MLRDKTIFEFCKRFIVMDVLVFMATSNKTIFKFCKRFFSRKKCVNITCIWATSS